MDSWELDGAHAEIERLTALHQSKKPLYSDRFLSTQTPGTEHFGAPQDAQLSHDDILGAILELAEQHGVSSARVRGMCMLTHARANLGYSPEEEAQVLNEVALTMDAGKLNVSDDRILALSGRADDTFTPGAEDRRTVVRDEAMTLGLTVTQAQRDALVKTGHAMPGGDFPIHDAPHLAAAKAEFKKGNLAGHSKAEVRAHISKNAKRLGLPGLDEGHDEDEDEDHDEDDVAATMGLTQETAAMALAAGSGGDSAAAVIARHPELSHLFKAGKTSRRRHPRKSGPGHEVTTDSRAHHSDTGDEDPRDTRQPGKGGEVHRGVREILRDDLAGVFAPDSGREGEGTGNISYPAKPAGVREGEEVRARAGGRLQGRITR